MFHRMPGIEIKFVHCKFFDKEVKIKIEVDKVPRGDGSSLFYYRPTICYEDQNTKCINKNNCEHMQEKKCEK